MSKAQTKILGYLMAHDAQTVFDIIGKLRAEWFDNGINRKAFDVINDLNSRLEIANLVSIVSALRESKQLDNGYIATLSKISTQGEWNRASLLTQIAVLEREYKICEVYRFTEHTKRGALEDTLTLDSHIENLKEHLEIMQDTQIEEETNEQLIDEIIENHNRAKDGDFSGITMGMPQLQKDILIENVDLVIIGARPAMGKTVFAIEYLYRKCFNHNEPTSLFALEMSKTQMMRRILARITGIDSKKIKLGQCSDDEMEQIRLAKHLPEWKNVHIYEGSHSIMQITRQVTMDKHRFGITSFVVDYLQKITASKGKTEFEKATANSNELKELVQNIKVPAVALAQLKRPNVVNASVELPTLSDLRGSGDMEQDGSIIMFLHRPEYYGQGQKGLGQLCLAKNREGETNKVYNFSVDNTISKWGDYVESIKSNLNSNNEEPF